MRLNEALAEAADFGVAENLDRLRGHLPAEWIEAALGWSAPRRCVVDAAQTLAAAQTTH
jgi:hypothetical protein